MHGKDTRGCCLLRYYWQIFVYPVPGTRVERVMRGNQTGSGFPLVSLSSLDSSLPRQRPSPLVLAFSSCSSILSRPLARPSYEGIDCCIGFLNIAGESTRQQRSYTTRFEFIIHKTSPRHTILPFDRSVTIGVIHTSIGLITTHLCSCISYICA